MSTLWDAFSEAGINHYDTVGMMVRTFNVIDGHNNLINGIRRGAGGCGLLQPLYM